MIEIVCELGLMYKMEARKISDEWIAHTYSMKLTNLINLKDDELEEKMAGFCEKVNIKIM